MSVNEDDDLLIGLKANKEEYQKKLIDRYSGYLLSCAMKQGLGREDALEVINDVFYKTILHINKFDISRGCKFSTWLYQITKYAAIDKLKIKQQAFEDDFELLDEKSNRIESETWKEVDCPESEAGALSKSILIEVLNGLNNNDKMILLERSYDKPFKEIANLIGKKENAVKVAHYRALERLKNAYIAKIESVEYVTRVEIKTYLNIGDRNE